MKIEKLIFLDFDGVIVSQRTRWNYFDRDCMKYLQEIVKATNAYIVISSTWRIGTSFRLLRALFEPYNLFDRVIGVTPNLLKNMKRGEEIDAWIKNPKLYASGELNIKSFIILDDDSDMKPHMDRLLQTHPIEGLREEDISRAIKMLDLPTE